MKKQDTAPSAEKTHRYHSISALLIAVFVEGLMVTSVELLGAKMLIPLYGNSLVVWTSVLGITISFLALGYFYGGMLSRKKDLLKKLSMLFAITSLLILLMPVLAGVLFGWLMGISVYTGSVMAATLLLGPPLFMLGTSSPLMVQLVSERLIAGQHVHRSGESAGTVYAISTLAGVIFTFILGFVILPKWGISSPAFILAMLLFAVSCYLHFAKKYIVLLACFFVLTLKLCSDQKTNKTSAAKILYESEGLLGQLKVVDIMDPQYKVPFRYLFINGIPQSVITNEDSPMKGASGWPYIHQIAMLASRKQDQQQVLLLGIGGGSLARELNGKKNSVDLVDLDPRMFAIAKKYFYMEAPESSFTCDDARHYVRTSKKVYDLIVMDVFNAEVQPSYMFTRESFAELKNILAKDGMMIFNFGEKVKHEGISAYESVCNTLLEAGMKVYCGYKEGEGINDILIISSPGPIDLSRLNKKDINACCAQQPWADEFIARPAQEIQTPFANGIILTDDKPRLEILNAETIKTWREWAIKTYAIPELEEHRMLFR